MKGSIRNLIVTSVLIVTAGGLAGCATATSSIESGNDIAAAATGNPVVFGKFRLIRNGNEARIGNDLLSTTATLTLKQAGSAEEFVGAVGADGEFAWALEPGFYRVASIGFDNRGERVEPITNFTFKVNGDHEAVYIGTVTLEAAPEHSISELEPDLIHSHHVWLLSSLLKDLAPETPIVIDLRRHNERLRARVHALSQAETPAAASAVQLLGRPEQLIGRGQRVIDRVQRRCKPHRPAGGITAAVEEARFRNPDIMIETEVENMTELEEGRLSEGGWTGETSASSEPATSSTTRMIAAPITSGTSSCRK